jgi:hypothetical protein
VTTSFYITPIKNNAAFLYMTFISVGIIFPKILLSLPSTEIRSAENEILLLIAIMNEFMENIKYRLSSELGS